MPTLPRDTHRRYLCNNKDSGIVNPGLWMKASIKTLRMISHHLCCVTPVFTCKESGIARSFGYEKTKTVEVSKSIPRQHGTVWMRSFIKNLKKCVTEKQVLLSLQWDCTVNKISNKTLEWYVTSYHYTDCSTIETKTKQYVRFLGLFL